MDKRKQKLKRAFLLDGSPVHIFDNVGRGIYPERFCVVFMDSENGGYYNCVAMPINPMENGNKSIGGKTVYARHLGQRILFEELPPMCRKFLSYFQPKYL